MKKKKVGITCGKQTIYIIKRILLEHHSDFLCLNCLCSFRKENEITFHEKVCKNKGICDIVMPSGKDNVLELCQYMISDKMNL